MRSFDLVLGLCFWGAILVVGLAYSIRVVIAGRAISTRVEQMGGSWFLGKSIMEFGIWALGPVGRFAVWIKVSANQVTAASLVAGVLGAFALAWGYFGIGTWFLALASLADALDGMLARATGTASESGEVFDAAADRYVEFFMLAGVMIYFSGSPLGQLLTVTVLAGSFMVSYASAKAETYRIAAQRGVMRRPERAVYLTVGAALMPLWRLVEGWPPSLPLVLVLLVVACSSHYSAIERLFILAHAVRRAEAPSLRPATKLVPRGTMGRHK